MDRLASLFEQLTLPEVAQLLRRTALTALGAAILAIALSVVLSHPLVGAGICIGLGLGLVNIRLIIRSVAKVNAEGPPKPSRVLAGRAISRLAMTTVVVIGLMIASVSLGIATAGGIAIFYLVLIINLLVALLRPGATGVPL